MAERLDNIDKRILFELDLNSRIPEAELARMIRASRETVRYRIAQLAAKGILRGYTTLINVAKLGYSGYKVYLKIGGSREAQKRFFGHIRSRDDVFWLGVADGAWDVGLTFFAKNNGDFFREKNAIFSQFGGIIFERKVGVLADIRVFPKKFLYGAEREPALMFGEAAANGLDDVERRLLGLLFHNARMRVVDLAEGTGSSVEIVRNRMKRLEEKGIVVRYGISIDHTKMGMEFYKAFLYFNDLSEASERRLLEFCRQHPNILHVVRQISPWDVELEIMVSAHSDYNRIMHQLRGLFPDELRNIESAVMSEDYIFPAKKTIFD